MYFSTDPQTAANQRKLLTFGATMKFNQAELEKVTKPVGKLAYLTVKKVMTRRDLLKAWLVKNDDHQSYSRVLKNLESVYDELRSRDIINIDA